MSIRAEGGIDGIYTVSSSKPGWLHGVHFTFNAQAPTLNEALAPASPYIDGAIPVVGPFRLTADIIDRQGQLTVDPIQIQLGPVDQPLLQAEGVVKDRSTNRSRFEALFTVPTAEVIAL